MTDHPRNTSARPAARVTVTVGALIAAAALIPTACVPYGRYAHSEQERERCETRYEELSAEVADANRTGEALAQEKTALETKVAALQTQGNELGSKLRETQETYDGLVADLKKELKAGQVQVKQLRDGLRVDVAQDILFDSGSAELDTHGAELLQRVAARLKTTSHQIVVTGHTDDRPIGPGLLRQYPTNWELAGARAASVVRLFDRSGVSAKRLLAVSMADIRPVASNKTPEGRAKNRRIEIRLRPPVAEG